MTVEMLGLRTGSGEIRRNVPTRGWPTLGLPDLWTFRHLLFLLISKDVKVRYKQTLFGAAWAILNPLFLMLIFTFFFGYLTRIETDVPYPIFVFSALVPWFFFSSGVSNAAGSLVASSSLIQKAYFPRLVLPVASIGAALVDFAMALLVLAGFMVFYGFFPSWETLAVPPLILLTFLLAVGIGLWLAALNALYRDFQFLVGLLLQLGLFLSPIAYPRSLLSQPWKTIFALNPVAGIVEGFRWALLGAPIEVFPVILFSVLGTAVILLGGLLFFRRLEGRFAEVI